jgi:hypothetical protein
VVSVNIRGRLSVTPEKLFDAVEIQIDLEISMAKPFKVSATPRRVAFVPASLLGIVFQKLA